MHVKFELPISTGSGIKYDTSTRHTQNSSEADWHFKTEQIIVMTSYLRNKIQIILIKFNSSTLLQLASTKFHFLNVFIIGENRLCVKTIFWFLQKENFRFSGLVYTHPARSQGYESLLCVLYFSNKKSTT